jgi:hypothetical protein
VKRILYIVGAGLTKSLETSAQVPLMADFVSVMSQHVDDQIIAQVLAEYEQRAAFEWPSTRASGALAARVLAGDASALPGFAQSLRNRPAENIEAMLEKVISRDQKTADDFKRAINRVFWRVHPSLDLSLLRRFIAHQERVADATHRIISFNYDISLDVVLQESGLWHPATGYGFEIESHISTSQMEAMREEEAKGESPWLGFCHFEQRPDSRWLLLKPHGSLNWVWQYMRMGPFGLSVVLNDAGVVAYASDTEIPGRWHAGPMSGVPFALAIAPPGAKKLFDTHRGDTRGETLVERQRQAIREADEVFVLGWSLPKTDEYHEALLRACCYERRWPLDRAVIVNCRAPIEYFHKIRSVLGEPTNLDTHNEGFANFLTSLG